MTYAWDHPHFDIDEEGLGIGAAVMDDSVMRCLKEC